MTVSIWRRVTAKVLLVVLLGNPLLGAAWGAERASSLSEVLKARLAEEREALKRAAEQAAVGNQSGVRTNADGVTFINIATPSARGVSHNRFEQFNVPEAGVVLNNSQGPALSVLGGWSDGNRYLAGGTASLILTEVTGTGVSSLLGYTEVLGDSAEFVLANPNGIHCDGCGFINTPRVTFATGSALMHDGALQGFHIGGGKVVIEGAGLNASQVSKFDILSRAMSLNAALYANELNIVTGVNDVDYATGVVRAAEGMTDGGTAAEPGVQFALDASALGAMYANRIRLIGTEAGLGVRSDGLIQASESLTLSADGQIVLKDALAGQPLALESRSSGVTLNGTVYGSEVSVNAKEAVINNGTLAAAGSLSVQATRLTQQGDILAGVDSEGQWQEGGKIQLNVTTELNNSGRIISQGEQSTVQINSDSLINQQDGTIQSQSLTADVKQLTNSGLLLADTLTLTTDTLENRGQLQGQTITLTAEQLTQHEGVIYQQNAPSDIAGKLRIDATTLTTAGGVVVSEGEAIIQSQSIIQGGDWLLGGATTINAGQLTNSGTLQFLSSIALQSDLLDNSGQLLFMGQDTPELQIATRLTNSGLLQFNSADVNLSLPQLINTGGQLYHLGEGAFTLNAQRLDNQSGVLFSAGQAMLQLEQADNRAGSILQAGEGELVLNIADQFDNRGGQIVTEGNLQLNAASLQNQQGEILVTGQNATLLAETVINTEGSIQLAGMGALTIRTSDLLNEQGQLAAGNQLIVEADTLFSSGNIQGRTVDINSQQLSNAGQLLAETALNISTATLTNSGQLQGETVLLQGSELHNSGTVVATGLVADNGQAEALQLILAKVTNKGTIASYGQDFSLQNMSLDNSGGTLLHTGQGVLSVTTLDALNNLAGNIITHGDLSLVVSQLNNQDGLIQIAGAAGIETAVLDNTSGEILAAGEQLLRLQVTDLLDNRDGTIIGNQLALSSGTLFNQAGLVATVGNGNPAMVLDIAGLLNNQQGRIDAAGENATIRSNQLQNSEGEIYHTGTGVLMLQSTLLDNGMNGVIAANDQLFIESSTLSNQGILSSQGLMTLQATTLNNAQAAVIAAGDVNINSEQLLNQGAISAGNIRIDSQQIVQSGQLVAQGLLQLDAIHLDNREGVIQAGQGAVLQLDTLDNREGEIWQLGQDALALKTTSLLDNRNGVIATNSAEATIQSQRLLNDQGLIQSVQQLDIEAVELANQAGSIQAETLLITASDLSQNEQGEILANQLVIDSARILNDQGLIHAADTLQITAEELDNRGVINSGVASLNVTDLRNSQLIQAAQLNITAGNLQNSGLLLASGTQERSFQLSASEIHNTGAIESYGQHFLVQGQLFNTSGTLLHHGLGVLQLAELNNAQGVVHTAGDLEVTGTQLDNRQGLLQAAGALSLQGTGLDNRQGAIRSGGDLSLLLNQADNRSGEISSQGQQVSLDIAGILQNDDGVVVANQAHVTIGAGQITQADGVIAGQSLQITADSLENNGGGLYAGTQLQLNVAELANLNGGEINARRVDISSISLRNNDSVIYAAEQLQLAGNQIDNQRGVLSSNELIVNLNAEQTPLDEIALDNRAGQILAGSQLVINTPYTIDNRDGAILSEGILQIDSGNLNNQAGELLAAQGIAITVNGELNNTAGVIYNQQGQLSLTALLLNNLENGVISQQGSAPLLLGAQELHNRGQINAAAMTIEAALLNNSGVLDASVLEITAEQIRNSGYLTADQAQITAGVLDNSAGVISTKATAGNTAELLLDTTTLINRQGVIQSHADSLSISGQVNNQQGEILLLGNGTLSLGELQNQQGLVISAGDLHLQGNTDNNSGQLQAAGAVVAQSTDSSNTVFSNVAGIVHAGTSLDIRTQNLNNQQGRLSAANSIVVDASELLNNRSGIIAATNLVTLSSAELNNSAEGMINGQQLILQADSINNSYGVLQAGNLLELRSSSLNNEGGQLQAERLTLSAVTINNTDGMIVATGTADNALQLTDVSSFINQRGTLASYADNWAFTLGDLSNELGRVLHLGSGTLEINADTISNSGTLASTGQMHLNADVTNRGQIQAQTQLQLIGNLDNQANAAITAGTISIDAAAGVVTNAGELSALSAVSIAGNQLVNQGVIYAADTVTLQADTLENRGGISAAALQITDFSLLQNSGRIESQQAVFSGQTLDNQTGGALVVAGTGQALQLDTALLRNSGSLFNNSTDMAIGGELINQGALVHAGSGVLLLGSNGAVSNQQGSIATAGSAELRGSVSSSGTLFAEKALTINTDGTFNNAGGQLYTKGNLQVNSALDNQQGSLIADGQLLLETSGNINNQSGRIQGSSLTLSAAGTLNNSQGTITSTGAGNSQIIAGLINNLNGLIQSAGTHLSIDAGTGGINNQQGRILHAGSGVLTLESLGTVDNRNQGSIQSAGQLVADIQGALNNQSGVVTAGILNLGVSGLLDNTGGTLMATAASGSSSIRSGQLNNSQGTLAANGSGLTITTGALTNNQGNILQAGLGVLRIDATTLTNTSSDVVNNGRIVGNGAIDINLTGALQNSGVISAAQLLDIDAATVTNSGNGLLGSRAGAVVIDATTLINSATISGVTATTLTTNTLNNQGGYIQSDGTVTINTGQLTVGNITGQNISATVRSALTLGSQEQLQATNNLDLKTSGSLTNSGNIIGGNQLLLSSTTIDNLQGGTIKAGSLATLTTGTLTNSGTIGSGHTLNLNLNLLGEDSINHGTIAANNTLNITGDIDNTNLLYAGKQLTMTGSLFNLTQGDGLASVYSGGNLQITGDVIFNQGGSIAAADDLSLSGKITNTFIGELVEVLGETTTENVKISTSYSDWSNAATRLVTTTREERVTTLYEYTLEGKQGRITSGRDMYLNGETVNEYGVITAKRDLDISGVNFTPKSVINQSITYTTVYIENETELCSYPYRSGSQIIDCIEPGEVVQSEEYLVEEKAPIVDYISGSLGTVVAGNKITGNLKGKVEQIVASPIDPENQIVQTDVETARGSVSRGTQSIMASSGAIQITASLGTLIGTDVQGRELSGASGTDIGELPDEPAGVTPDYQGSELQARQLTGAENSQYQISYQAQQGYVQQDGQFIDVKASQQQAVGAAINTADLNTDYQAGNALNAESQTSAPALYQGTVRSGEQWAGLGSAEARFGVVETSSGSDTKHRGADSIQPVMEVIASDSTAPTPPYNSSQTEQVIVIDDTSNAAAKTLLGMTDSHSGIIAEQNLVLQAGGNISLEGSSLPAGNLSAGGAPVGQNVFMTDEQIRVLTEDLGFNADDINKGQQALYSAISLNDLLPDGVTLSAGGVIDIYAAEGMRIDAGVHAGEGLILRTDGGLQTKDTTFLDSDKFIGLQIGSDFTNNMALNSDELWLDIGGSFTNSGSMAGGLIDISAGKDMHNLGSLDGTYIGVNAGGTLLNTGSMIADGLLNLKAGEDLINRGGHLEGNDVLLKAGGDIINRTEFEQYTYTDKNGNSYTNTFVGPSSEIVSHNNLSMDAGRNVDLQGSKLAAANNIDIAAGNDVLLGAIENLSGHEKYFKGGHDIEVNRTYDVVSMDAGNNLSIRAGNNIESEGAQFSAGNIASLIAENEMNLLAVVESHYDADKTTRKSTFSKRVTETVSLHEEVQGTVINAGTILLNAEVGEDGQVVKAASGDITLVGGELNADNDIIAFGKDITITAGTYQDYEYSHTSKSSFGGLKSKSQEDLAQDVLLSGSTVSAGGTVLLESEGNIAIISSDLKGQDVGLKAFDDILIASGEESRIRESRSQSGGFLSGGSLYSSVEQMTGTAHITANSSAVHANGNLVIDAGSATVIGSKVSADGILQVSTDVGDIRVLAAEERTETVFYEQRIKLGLDALTNAITRPDKLINTDNGQVSISLGKAEYEENEFKSTSVTHKGSELDGKRGVVLDSAGDVLVEGSSVNSDEGTIYVKAGGDITVRDVIDRYEDQSKSVQGSAEISVVVQHQAVEVAKAAMAVDDAKDLVKQAEADYRKYKKERDALEETLVKLEQDYQNKVPGVTYSDINELKALLGDIKDDEAWYLAGIASATANLVSKTTLLIQQTAAAAQSSATYGFNAGLQLAITGSESQSQTTATTSQGSTLTGQNILLMTGEEGKTGNITIQGSVVEADQALAIATNTLNVLAGQSTLQSQNSQQQASIVISQTVWGAAGGPSVNASYSNSQNRDQQTTHTNSSLSGDRVTIITEGDANIIGGNIHGDTSVAMTIGGDLRLESVQDRASGSSQGFGISGGMSFGGDFTNKNGAAANSKEAKTTSIGGTNGVAGVNGGLNASSGRYQSSETVLSSITGGEVDINVTGHTELIGALIAARDEDGNDTGKLTFSTDSLNIEHLSNRSYSSNQSAGVSANVAVSSQANAGNPTQSNTDLALNSSNYSYQNNSSQSLDKTLATIGQGIISVGGEAVNPEGLNRDINNLTKDIYDVDRQQGNIELTVDHRLLSEDGRKQIAEDVKRTEILGDSLIDLAKVSVSVTGSDEGETSLRDHIGNKQDYFTATKNFTQNADNAEHIATLGNDNATPEQKQAAYTALANSIAQQMGVSPTEALVLMENDPQFAGVHSRDTGNLYINDLAHNSAGEAVNTVGHETQHYLDNQQNPNASQSTEYKANRENYADIMGNATEDYLKFNFAQNDYSLAGNNNHSMGTTLDEALRNQQIVNNNNKTYGQEYIDKLDYRYLSPAEQELASKLAQESGGRFTVQEMADALRHTLSLPEGEQYPAGQTAYVLDTATATGDTLKYLDGSEGRLIVTQDEEGNARYIVQDISRIPLNEEAKAYIKEQDLGYSFSESMSGNPVPSWLKDPLTGRALDDNGQYWVGYDVEGKSYSVPHYSCATADCLSQKLNIDWNSAEGQAYFNALNVKALNDVSDAATGILLFTPAGGVATGLGFVSTGAGLGASYLDGELFKEVSANASSKIFEAALSDMLGSTLGVKVNTALDLLGVHDQNVIFIPKDDELADKLKVIFNEDK